MKKDSDSYTLVYIKTEKQLISLFLSLSLSTLIPSLNTDLITKCCRVGLKEPNSELGRDSRMNERKRTLFTPSLALKHTPLTCCFSKVPFLLILFWPETNNINGDKFFIKWVVDFL